MPAESPSRPVPTVSFFIGVSPCCCITAREARGLLCLIFSTHPSDTRNARTTSSRTGLSTSRFTEEKSPYSADDSQRVTKSFVLNKTSNDSSPKSREPFLRSVRRTVIEHQHLNSEGILGPRADDALLKKLPMVVVGDEDGDAARRRDTLTSKRTPPSAASAPVQFPGGGCGGVGGVGRGWIRRAGNRRWRRRRGYGSRRDFPRGRARQ